MRLPTATTVITTAFLSAVLGPVYAHAGHTHSASLVSVLLPLAMISIAVLTLAASTRIRAHRKAWRFAGIVAASNSFWLLLGA